MSLFLKKFIKLDPDPDPQKMNADPQPWSRNKIHYHPPFSVRAVPHSVQYNAELSNEHVQLFWTCHEHRVMPFYRQSRVIIVSRHSTSFFKRIKQNFYRIIRTDIDLIKYTHTHHNHLPLHLAVILSSRQWRGNALTRILTWVPSSDTMTWSPARLPKQISWSNVMYVRNPPIITK